MIAEQKIVQVLDAEVQFVARPALDELYAAHHAAHLVLPTPAGGHHRFNPQHLWRQLLDGGRVSEKPVQGAEDRPGEDG